MWVWFTSRPLAASERTKTTSDKSPFTLSAGLVAETNGIDSKSISQNYSDDNKSHSRLIPAGKLDSLAANHSGVRGRARRSGRFEAIQRLSQSKRGSNARPQHHHAFTELQVTENKRLLSLFFLSDQTCSFLPNGSRDGNYFWKAFDASKRYLITFGDNIYVCQNERPQ